MAALLPTSTQTELLLDKVHAAREALTVCEGDEAVAGARATLADELHALLTDVSTHECPGDMRQKIDVSLGPHATALKGALLKALKVCVLYRAFTGLPVLMEETRKLLCSSPAKGVATYLETDLCADIDACTDAQALQCVKARAYQTRV